MESTLWTCWQLLKNKTAPENCLVCLTLLSCMVLLSFLPFSPFSFLSPSLPPNSFTLFWYPSFFLLALAALKRFAFSPLASISHLGGLLQCLCGNKWKGGFILFLSAWQLSACISSLPILLSHPRYHVFRKYPAVFLNAFSRVESALGRFLCLLMLAKEVQLFILYQLFKQNKQPPTPRTVQYPVN